MSADDHAAAALKLARKKQAGGDDTGAMKMAQKSLRILESDEAQKLVDHISKFGDASEMAATARRIIEAADLYAVLQLAHDATPEDVKKAYHRTSKIVHPDKNKSRLSDDAFKRVGEAFKTLSDPRQKQVYDLKRSEHGRRPHAAPQPAHAAPRTAHAAPQAHAHAQAGPQSSAWHQHAHHQSGGGHVCQSCILGGAAELPRLRRENDALLKKAQTLQQQVQQAVAQLKQQQRDALAAQRRLQTELEEVEKRRGKTEAQMHELRRQLVQKEKAQKEKEVQKEKSHAQELQSLREELSRARMLVPGAASPPPPLSPEDVLWLAHTPLAARTAKSRSHEPPPYIAWGDPLCAVSAVPPVPRSLPRG